MKIYDKEIYKEQENMRMVIVIIVTFLIGFAVGYLGSSMTHNTKQNTNNMVANETID